MNATAIVRDALAGSGIEAIGSCGIAAYDARAPEAYRSSRLLPGAAGLVVAASAGPALWRKFVEHMDRGSGSWDEPHPYDAFVGTLLGRADAALRACGIRSLRFEARFDAPLPADFVALAELAGMGARGPFGLLIHPEHGPWWALRGAWLVDRDVEERPASPPACHGCPAPCIGGWENAGPGIALASPEARLRCVVGAFSRYDDDQLDYHHARDATVARLRARRAPRA